MPTNTLRHGVTADAALRHDYVIQAAAPFRRY